MTNLKNVKIQKRALMPHTGEVLLFVSRFYDEGSGSCHIKSEPFGLYINDDGRLCYGSLGDQYILHPDGSWMVNHDGKPTNFYPKLGDRIFSLGDPDDLEDLKVRLDGLGALPRGFTLDDLQKEFEEAQLVWKSFNQ